jgi:nucleotide-binding universal stress UspA family protein
MARVLVPVDDKEHARRACDLAVELFSGGEVVLLHVINPADAGYSSEAAIPRVAEDWYEQRTDEAGVLLDEFEAHIGEQAGDDAVTVERCVEVGNPARTITEYVETRDIDHVVMGSHGRRGISRVLLGSVAETVVRHSPVPVTVVQ